MAMPQMPKWYDDDGQIVSCTEKVKVMTENLNEPVSYTHLTLPTIYSV